MKTGFYRLSIIALLWMLTINTWDEWSLFTQAVAFIACATGAAVAGWTMAQRRSDG